MYENVIFIGSKQLGALMLKELHMQASEKLKACITVDDSNETRSKLREISDYCNKNTLPLYVLNGKCDITDIINKHEPELCIVAGWYYVISQTLLEKVRGGFVGIHNSLLPKYRGFSPLVWAMINGEREVGFSVFSFAPKMDTGKIYYQQKIIIGENDYIQDVLDCIEGKVIEFFRNNYKDLLNETLIAYPQKNILPSYCARRTEWDGRINWSWNNKRILNFIKAQSTPYPGAFSTYKENRVIIWKAKLFINDIYGSPGQIGIIDKEKKYIVVVCGENTGLIIEQVEIDGKTYGVTEIVKSLVAGFE